jgi:hypothetical protein
MRTPVAAFAVVGLLMIASTAMADPIIFFEEQFSGPTLDPSVWRTEVLTSGVRWCDSDPGQQWGPGTWIDEGSECYGVAAYSPYGTAILSEDLLQISSDNGQACPYLVSRLPGLVQMFPATGDFAVTLRMRYDRLTPWGAGVLIMETDSTEPLDGNPPTLRDDVLVQLWGATINSSLSGSFQQVAYMPPPNEMHEFGLECVGNSYTIRIDGQVVYGPISSTLRPTAVWIGNPVLAYWYPTDWQAFSVDYLRVEVPGPSPVAPTTWGAIKAMYVD